MTHTLLLLLACSGSTTGDTDTADTTGDDTAATADTHPDCTADTWWPDADDDGYGDPDTDPTTGCDAPGSAWVGNDRDCDDGDPGSWPGAQEVCDDRDNNCDGRTDEDVNAGPWWPDSDGDGAGDRDAEGVDGCSPGDGFTDNDWDCDDRDAGSPLFVDPAGATGATGTLHDPNPSLAGALGERPGCVALFPGVHKTNASLPAGVEVYGLQGSAATFITSEAADTIFYAFESGQPTIVRGVTLTEGAGYQYEFTSGSDDYTYYYGGAIYHMDADLVLEDVVFLNNRLPLNDSRYNSTGGRSYTYSTGGALYSYGGRVQMTDVDFVGGSAGWGGVISGQYAELYMTRVRLLGNEGSEELVDLWNTTLTAHNLLAAQNVAGANYAVIGAYYGSADLHHLTLADNAADYGLQVQMDPGSLWMSDSIVESTGYGVVDYYAAGTYETSDWWTTYGNYYAADPGDPGHLFEDPRFSSRDLGADASLDAYRLSGDSPCVDAGADGDMGAFGGPEAWQ